MFLVNQVDNKAKAQMCGRTPKYAQKEKLLFLLIAEYKMVFLNHNSYMQATG